MFKITSNKGFHVTINGYTLSTQFGYGNYCQNRDIESAVASIEFIENYDAEIAIWDKEGKFVTKKILTDMGVTYNFDDVAGWIDSNKWGMIVAYLTTINEEEKE